MFENPRRGREARNFTTNVLKILDLKSSSKQMFSENWRWVPLSRFYMLHKKRKWAKMRPKWKAHCAVNCVHFIDGRKNRAFVVNGFLYFNVTRRSNSVQKFKKNIILFIQLFPVLWQGTKLYIEQVLHHIYWTSSVSPALHFLLLCQSKLASCTSRLKCQRGRTRNSGLYIDHRSRHRHRNWDSYCISQHSLHLGRGVASIYARTPVRTAEICEKIFSH